MVADLGSYAQAIEHWETNITEAHSERSRKTAAVIAAIAILTSACSAGGASTAQNGSPSGGGVGSNLSSHNPSFNHNENLVIWTNSAELANVVERISGTFARKNNVDVQVKTITTDLQTAFAGADSSGTGPDIVIGASDWIGNLVKKRSVSPLNLSSGELNEYAHSAVRAVTYSGRIYGLPWDVEAPALFRNTNIADRPERTLDQALADGQASVAAGRMPLAFALPVGKSGDPFLMEPLYTSMGGYIFGAGRHGQYKPKDLGVGKAGSIAAAKRISSLGARGSRVLTQSVSDSNYISLFAQGKAAFMVSGPWALPTLDHSGLSYAIQPLPGFAGEKSAVPFMSSQVFMIARHAKNPVVAQRFLADGLNNPQAMAAISRGFGEPSAMTSVALSSSDPHIRALFEAARISDPVPSIPAMDAVWTPLGRAYAAIVAGAYPGAAMTHAARVIAHAIRRMDQP